MKTELIVIILCWAAFLTIGYLVIKGGHHLPDDDRK